MHTLYPLVFILVVAAQSVSAEEVLWKSGRNLYIKIAEQGKGGEMPSDHPVTLDKNKLFHALRGINAWRQKYFKKRETETLFSIQQAQLLSQYVAAGLKQAKPDEDIVFALPRVRAGSFKILKEKTFMAGRVFFQEDKLNIIIGDYDRSPDRFKETASGGHGVTDIKYFFNEGSRSRASKFKKRVTANDGISNFERDSKKRADWIVIDIDRAAAAYVAEKTVKDQKTDGLSPRQAEEMAKLAKERREMRLEMARLRKEMKQNTQGQNSQKGDGLSIEARLQQLQDLRDKELITEDEYTQKRKQILDNI